MLAIELANTIRAARGRPVDGLGSPAEMRAWLRGLGITPPRGARLDELRALRADVRELLDGRPAAATIARLNGHAARVPTYPVLRWPAAIEERSPNADRWAQLLARFARSAIELAAGDAPVRSCGAPGCVLYFVQDHPRREWCSDACGNRVRAARHYARHRR
jgi:predicted RNA-binding Zn ribbon-like protein